MSYFKGMYHRYIWLTVTAMVISFTSFILTDYCILNTRAQINQQFDQSQQHITLYFQHKSKTVHFENFLKLLSNVPYKSLIQIHSQVYNIQNDPIFIFSATPNQIDKKMYSGRDLHPNDIDPYGVVITDHQTPIQKREPIIINDTVIKPIGKAMTHNAAHILKPYDYSMQVSPLTFTRLFGKTPPQSIIITPENSKKSHEAEQMIRDCIHKFHNEFNTHIIAPNDVTTLKTQTLKTINAASFGLKALIAILAIASLTNLNVSIYSQRQPEFALRQAIGAKPRDIIKMLFLETWSICLLSGGISILISLMIISKTNALMNWGHGISWLTLIKSMSFITFVSMVSSFLPAQKTFTIPIAHTLKGA